MSFCTLRKIKVKQTEIIRFLYFVCGREDKIL